MKLIFSFLLVFIIHTCASYGPPRRGNAGPSNVGTSGEIGVGRLEEVFGWKQITYNIDGKAILTSRYGGPVAQPDETGESWVFPDVDEEKPESAAAPEAEAPSIPEPGAGADQFFNQYNNIPMGVDKYKNKLFITVPRRRGGIPSTLNYIDLDQDKTKSPGLRPYPNLKANSLEGGGLVNVYRTRIDACDRLWMVDTGVDETPGAYRQVQPPAIVIFDLKTDTLIKRYNLKPDDDFINNDPAGFASITVDVTSKDCDNAYAYLPDLNNYGLVVYSLKEDNSWRVGHNYFYLDPEEGDYSINGLNFQWGDGVFSVALGPIERDGFRMAYFHAMSSFKERAVNTRVLRNITLATRDYHGNDFIPLGTKGPNSQTAMHGIHQQSGTMFQAQVGRNALGCWNTKKPFKKENFQLLAQDSVYFVYPADLKVYDNDVWIMVNRMPIFAYSTLNPDEVNFRIYKAPVSQLVSRTVCE